MKMRGLLVRVFTEKEAKKSDVSMEITSCTLGSTNTATFRKLLGTTKVCKNYITVEGKTYRMVSSFPIGSFFVDCEGHITKKDRKNIGAFFEKLCYGYGSSPAI